MNGIVIREATAGEVPVIHDLLTRLENSLGAAGRVGREPADLYRYGFSDTPRFHALIAWRQDDAVGLALYFPEFSSWKGKPGVYVQDLYVAEGERGGGLGRKLMEAVFTAAREWGAEYCKLAVYDDNRPAIAFYERLGFRVRKSECTLLLDNGL